MHRILAIIIIGMVLAAGGLVYITASSTASEGEEIEVIEYFSPLEQEVYVSRSERILYVPWHGSLKAFDTFFVSYKSIDATHTEAMLVIDGSENKATIGKKLEFTDTEGDKYLAVIEEIHCQYTKVRIIRL